MQNLYELLYNTSILQEWSIEEYEFSNFSRKKNLNLARDIWDNK